MYKQKIQSTTSGYTRYKKSTIYNFTVCYLPCYHCDSGGVRFFLLLKNKYKHREVKEQV